ncbi:putative WRKY transcription factor [Hibiscus syriacus]|uniref:Exocyst subunit Exo70 family protein n=1 Tax=Hibiscus syriacus TaxID=106335 RepID=A0A6A2YG92_HIBSY|nr:putative WRKY transcription factor [Hibiscus syriacus]
MWISIEMMMISRNRSLFDGWIPHSSDDSGGEEAASLNGWEIEAKRLWRLSRGLGCKKVTKAQLRENKTLGLALEKAGSRIEEINQRLPSLEAAVRPIRADKDALAAVGGHINRAVGPAAAVLKVFDAVHGLEKSLLSDPRNDLPGYLSVLKRLEEALRFLSDNCGLAIQWLEDIIEYLEGNRVADGRYLSNLKTSLKGLRELQNDGEIIHLDGGLLDAALDQLENEFRRLLTEHSVPLPMSSPSLGEQACIAQSPLPVAVIQMLQAILGRLIANNRLEKCITIYVEVRNSNVRASLKALDLDYLEISVSEFKDVQSIEGYIGQWGRHLEFAVKHLFEAEFKLCNDVFERIGLDALWGAACIEIQNLTRDLIKRVIDGVAEIFWEIFVQVELQRQIPPPQDGSIPKLVFFITEYCNKLLDDEYRPILTQVLVIHQSWKHKKFQEMILVNEVLKIIKAVDLNLETWVKAYGDATLSYLFAMNSHWHLYKHLKGTKIGELMGDAWLKEHEQCKEYYSTLFLRESWGKLPGHLSREGLILFSGGCATARDLVKKRLKTFNEAFDEMRFYPSIKAICKLMGHWWSKMPVPVNMQSTQCRGWNKCPFSFLPRPERYGSFKGRPTDSKIGNRVDLRRTASAVA